MSTKSKSVKKVVEKIVMIESDEEDTESVSSPEITTEAVATQTDPRADEIKALINIFEDFIKVFSEKEKSSKDDEINLITFLTSNVNKSIDPESFGKYLISYSTKKHELASSQGDAFIALQNLRLAEIKYMNEHCQNLQQQIQQLKDGQTSA
jgi:hypothetical protein